jgi:phage shock protein A
MTNEITEEKRMTNDANFAKQIVQDKLDSQIKTLEAKLDTLKARADAAKANVEIKAYVALLDEKQAIEQKLQELKQSGDERWKQAEADSGRMADFE